MNFGQRRHWAQILYKNYNPSQTEPILEVSPNTSDRTLEALNLEITSLLNFYQNRDDLYENHPFLVAKQEGNLEPLSGSVTASHYIEGTILNTLSYEKDVEYVNINRTVNPVKVITDTAKIYMNALLNMEGGTLFFGIKKSGLVSGILLSRKNRDDIRLRIDNLVASYTPQVDPHLIRVEFIPVIAPGSEVIESTEYIKFVVKIDVSQGTAPVYSMSQNRVFIKRNGNIELMDKKSVYKRFIRGRPSLKGNQLDIPNEFIGRESDLSVINKYVDGHKKHATVVLTGPPMVGKSTLASQLFENFKTTYPDRHFRVNMKGITEKYINYVEAQCFVIRSLHPILKLPAKKEEIQIMYEDCFKNLNCILLIENVGDFASLKPLIPTDPKGILIIITSRFNISDTPDDTLVLKLAPLSVENSVKLLNNIVGHDIEKDLAEKIVKFCSYMPMPIRMIASSIRRGKIRIEKLKPEDGKVVLDFTTKVFDSCYNSDSEIKDLAILSLFPSTFDESVVSNMLLLDSEEVHALLDRLVNSNELNISLESNRYSINDLFRAYLQSRILKLMDKETIDVYKRRFIDYYIKILQVCVLFCSQRSHMQGLDIFMREKDNIEVCLKYALEVKDPDLSAILYINMDKMINFFIEGEQRKWRKLLCPFLEESNIVKRISVFTSAKYN